jgi:putative NADPH-quinone reductase
MRLFFCVFIGYKFFLRGSMTNAITILASSRSSGRTREAVEMLVGNSFPIVDLNDLEISYYDYEYNNIDDDYLSLMERVVKYNMIILATPVYWYSMSAQMKSFIDRISDLLDIRKDIGRKLRGKDLFVVASFSTSLPKGFEDAFSQTCEYLGMNYKGCAFIYNGERQDFLQRNIEEIKKAKKILVT